jgi:hypothetical protein
MMLRCKRELYQTDTLTDTLTDTVTDTIAHGSAQWWYNRMSKQRRMRMSADLNARITYNPALARIELSIIFPNDKSNDKPNDKSNDKPNDTPDA